ncbi:MAG: cupredoxin family copper-binding protein, partial [Chloroflexi bacterium]|nr:cupredoxin family copper-binding protein [Chloroflexota bacterium]
LVLASASTVLAADHAVDIASFAFSPSSFTANVGDTVTWTNADAANHTASADDGSFDTGTISTNDSKSVTLSTAGTIAYHCRIHSAMTATIVVREAVGGSAPATDTAVAATAPAAAGGDSWGLLALATLAGVVLAWRRFGRIREVAEGD